MKDGAFIWLVLGAVFVASLRHIGEAWKNRDFRAMGEGIGTMMFSALGIILKALG
jgi:hypothetical protein